MNRTDHFQRIREEEAPKAAPEADAPKFSQEQAEYLRRVFRKNPVVGLQGMDSIVGAHTENAMQAGREEVIRHIEILARG